MDNFRHDVFPRGRARLAARTLSEGEETYLALDAAGNLKVSVASGDSGASALPNVSGDVAALSSVLNVDVNGALSVVAILKNTGSAAMAAGVFAFEASIDSTDGVNGNWVPILGSRSSANTAESSYTAAGLAAGAVFTTAWEFSVNGYKWFRIRVSTALTASSIGTWTVARSTAVAESTPVVPTHAVTQSGAFTTTPLAATTANTVSAASTNATLNNGSACSLVELSVFNPTAALVYLKLYNKATAPTVGTDVPVLTIAVPVNGEKTISFGPLGKRFATGLGWALTLSPLATATDAVAVGVQVSLTRF